MSNITDRTSPQLPSNLILNFVSLQLFYTTWMSNITDRTFPQLPSPTSSRTAPTSSRGLSACAVVLFSSGDIFSICLKNSRNIHNCCHNCQTCSWLSLLSTFDFRIIHKILIILILSCYMGNSRCATIAAAYLMIKKDYSATQALQYMRNSRYIVGGCHEMKLFTSKLYARDTIVGKAYLITYTSHNREMHKIT